MLKPKTPLPRHLLEFESNLWGRKAKSVQGALGSRGRAASRKNKPRDDEDEAGILISPIRSDKRSSSLPCISTPESVLKDLSGVPLERRERVDSISLPPANAAHLEAFDTPLDLQLGIKCSFMMKQWRLRERQLHEKALKVISSPTMASIKSHQKKVQRLEKIIKSVHGQGNKTKPGDLIKKTKVKHENRMIVDRLRRVQNTATEITLTNLPPEKDRCLQAVKFRGKFLKNARNTHAKKVQKDNARFLKRLNNTKATFNRKDWIVDYNRHKKIRRNMCRLENPKLFASKKKRRARDGLSPVVANSPISPP